MKHEVNVVFAAFVIAIVSFLLISCGAEKPNKAELLKGTWKGDLTYILGVEFKEYSPLLKDSIVEVADSVCTITNVTVNFSNDKVQFFGVKNTLLPKYVYSWEEDKLIFSKPPSRGKQHVQAETLDSVRNREAAVFRLNEDSLVMNISVYGGYQIDRVLKLKRAVK